MLYVNVHGRTHYDYKHVTFIILVPVFLSVSLCKMKPCTNGGICVESGGVRACKCIGSFSGDSCEHSKNCPSFFGL